jgi:hypothetical protein
VPSRIVREGILTSERVEALSWQAEVFYRRLMNVVDDYGRFYSRPALLRAACFPLRLDRVSDPDIGKWLRETEKTGLVRAYQVEGKGYLELLDFRQRSRAKESRFPGPSALCPSNDGQMSDKSPADAHVVEVVVGDVVEVVNTVDASPVGSAGRQAKTLNGHPKATRLASDWRLPDEWRDWAVTVHRLEPQRAVRISLAFRDFWIAKAGKDGAKLDWAATWRNWVRREMGDA